MKAAKITMGVSVQSKNGVLHIWRGLENELVLL